MFGRFGLVLLVQATLLIISSLTLLSPQIPGRSGNFLQLLGAEATQLDCISVSTASTYITIDPSIHTSVLVDGCDNTVQLKIEATSATELTNFAVIVKNSNVLKLSFLANFGTGCTVTIDNMIVGTGGLAWSSGLNNGARG